VKLNKNSQIKNKERNIKHRYYSQTHLLPNNLGTTHREALKIAKQERGLFAMDKRAFIVQSPWKDVLLEKLIYSQMVR
jgi:hypothetical protein